MLRSDEGARGIRRARADRQGQRHAARRHQRPRAGRGDRLRTRVAQERPSRGAPDIPTSPATQTAATGMVLLDSRPLVALVGWNAWKTNRNEG